MGRELLVCSRVFHCRICNRLSHSQKIEDESSQKSDELYCRAAWWIIHFVHSMESHEKIHQIEYHALDGEMTSRIDGIGNSIDGSLNSLCQVRIKGEFPPPDFDQIVQSQKQGCDIMMGISVDSQKALDGQDKPFVLSEKGQSDLYGETTKDEFVRLKLLIDAYNETVRKRLYFKGGDSEPIKVIKAYTLLFEPFLAAIALAFGLMVVKFSQE